ncbi:HNH endonuclease [Aminipila butyrica]|uniref:HNH endonuclease n=1 Tax=Aminipila butyrica TaxID=433296 RepID=A0A858BYZ9_9FIRM|nr:HNH endonuclease signature motif containing protein [Aminipila butyrica]QIB69296.1 HNH endonuclease [Aminipila butyrica]
MSTQLNNNSAIALSKSARHCCLCRKYLPLSMQVHHIKEKKRGGTDELDNLIPVCIQCHSAIHTKTDMTRAFTDAELKSSRDIVYEMVSEGKLPVSDINIPSDFTQIVSLLKDELQKKEVGNNISETSMEILVKTYFYNTDIQIMNSDGEYSYVKIGSDMFFLNIEKYYKYPRQIIELLEKELLSEEDGGLHISPTGETFLQGLIGTIPTYTQVKVKCLNCGLHFIICTWDKERHTNKTIHCPECGANNGRNLVWIQEKPGFIFEDVPGNAMLCGME